MKRLSIGLLCVLLLLMTGCGRQPGESGTSEIPGSSAVSLTKTGQSTATVSQVFGISEGLACVGGKYQGKQGIFFIDSTGTVLADRVLTFAYSDFAYVPSVKDTCAHVQQEDGSWWLMNRKGDLLEETEQPRLSLDSREKFLEEVDGEELWGIRETDSQLVVLPPTYSWIESVSDSLYNYAVTAAGQPVLIDYDGAVQVTLPDTCRGAVAHDAGFVGEFDRGDGYTVYRHLDFTGRILSNTTYEALTPLYRCYAAGVQQGRLVLVDEAGSVCLRTTVATIQNERTAVAFDGELVAAVLADNTLGLYRVTFA